MSFQKHFRKIRNAKFTGHPVYVVGEEGSKYIVLGITTSPITNGVSNEPLEKNPEPNNKEKAYVRPKLSKEDKGACGERLKGWRLCGNDKRTVQTIIAKTAKNKK